MFSIFSVLNINNKIFLLTCCILIFGAWRAEPDSQAILAPNANYVLQIHLSGTIISITVTVEKYAVYRG